MRNYHSALSKELSGIPDGNMLRVGNSYVFCHDIKNGADILHRNADVMYSELAWSAGHEKFNERANSITSYEEYIAGINDCIFTLKVPTFIIAGKKEGKYLTSVNRQEFNSSINGAKAVLYCYNIDADMDFSDFKDIEVLDYISNKYRAVCDPCCGYGRAGKIFAQKGKSFIMSDYNKKCVGYIIKEMEGWLNTKI